MAGIWSNKRANVQTGNSKGREQFIEGQPVSGSFFPVHSFFHFLSFAPSRSFSGV